MESARCRGGSAEANNVFDAWSLRYGKYVWAAWDARVCDSNADHAYDASSLRQDGPVLADLLVQAHTALCGSIASEILISWASCFLLHGRRSCTFCTRCTLLDTLYVGTAIERR